MSDTDKSISFAIAAITFDGLCDSTHYVKKVMIRECGTSSLELWHAIDIKDFSSFRSFVTSPHGNLYDVDFLSRHEIIPPMSVDKLPLGWEKWASIHKNQLIINNKDEFCCRMMTQDATIALPTYRFDFLCDDIHNELTNSNSLDEAIEKVLQSLTTGYSYKQFSTCKHDMSVKCHPLNLMA